MDCRIIYSNKDINYEGRKQTLVWLLIKGHSSQKKLQITMVRLIWLQLQSLKITQKHAKHCAVYTMFSLSLFLLYF